MVMNTFGSSPAHVVTDAAVRIMRLSPLARTLLTGTGAERGGSLIDCFPAYRKALLLDIDVARVGWPTERSIESPGAGGIPLRYRVSRLLPGGGLYWEFETMHERTRRSA
jgi:hypothetical protein